MLMATCGQPDNGVSIASRLQPSGLIYIGHYFPGLVLLSTVDFQDPALLYCQDDDDCSVRPKGLSLGISNSGHIQGI
ncbi:MAG: hypothetical protein Alpg2KO_31130 [Alphaproteobacteria bacterium]